jgi:hypothetical protein
MRRILGAALAGVLVLAAGGARADDDPGDKVKGEFKRDPAKLFKRIDTNGDGKVSKEEFQAFFENAGQGKLKDRPRLIERLFERLDADGDGYLTLEEFKKLPQVREEMRAKAAKAKKGKDKDGDKKDKDDKGKGKGGDDNP